MGKGLGFRQEGDMTPRYWFRSSISTVSVMVRKCLSFPRNCWRQNAQDFAARAQTGGMPVTYEPTDRYSREAAFKDF
jgi:hypothetical protein